MAPILPDGSTVQVAPRSVYLPGDVIAFAAPNGSLRVHRVLGYHRGASGWRLLTKGDNTTWIDSPVPVDQVLGLVRGGDCARSVYQVSWRERLTAMDFFCRKSVAWLWRQLANPS